MATERQPTADEPRLFPPRPLQTWWQEYLRREHAAGKLNTPQRWALRRAFYAGASVMLATLCASASQGADDDPESRQAERLLVQALCNDVQQFVQDMSSGLA